MPNPGLHQESSVAEQWLETTLTGDGTMTGLVAGRVFDGPAPEFTPTPYVTYRSLSQRDIFGVGTARFFTTGIWLVYAVVQGSSYSLARPVAKQIDTLIHGSVDVVVANGIVLSCVREAIWREALVQGGEQYRHLGGQYRIMAQ